ncbi:hypothetical protein CBR_g46441 [Chara braunii]|uniref:NAD(P)-binding domain-containing protein n=1 Tax=Chara braunii TaxID=69332 RepID=A0A388M0G9_CHABU|nr:hypothetical protein CBR_g46441 [Chara braunii]|eukprot:GBG88070.1 hypothetical protein CBR_g46441 [Chara braunii]
MSVLPAGSSRLALGGRAQVGGTEWEAAGDWAAMAESAAVGGSSAIRMSGSTTCAACGACAGSAKTHRRRGAGAMAEVSDRVSLLMAGRERIDSPYSSSSPSSSSSSSSSSCISTSTSSLRRKGEMRMSLKTVADDERARTALIRHQRSGFAQRSDFPFPISSSSPSPPPPPPSSFSSFSSRRCQQPSPSPSRAGQGLVIVRASSSSSPSGPPSPKRWTRRKKRKEGQENGDGSGGSSVAVADDEEAAGRSGASAVAIANGRERDAIATDASGEGVGTSTSLSAGREVGEAGLEGSGRGGAILSLEDVNPVGLGRRSRQFFDDVWRRLTQLGQLATSRPEDQYESVLIGGPMCDFDVPSAQFTTVLVAGATGRVGRVIVRKLLLRGYNVKALVREADAATKEMLPTSVEIVEGDLGDPATLKAAVAGCTKVICCVAARSVLSGDLARVDHLGVYNLSKALLDLNHELAQRRAGRSSKSKLTLFKFSKTAAETMDGWELREGRTEYDQVASRFDGGMDASLEYGESGNGVFSGFVFTRGGYVEMHREFRVPDGSSLRRFEGLLLRVCGDGKPYSLILETAADGEESSERKQYFARFNTRLGYSRVRIPFSLFRPMSPSSPPFDPDLVQSMAIRFEPRKQSISCADVADVCVKALHDATARNKSFEVCYEYTLEEGQGLYELVAHLPDKANNYLTPALALLEKNT